MSKPIDNGGPAFPAGMAATTNANHDPIVYDSTERCVGGMTLRDWFAGMALPACITEAEEWYDKHGGCDVYERSTKSAYEFADSMIAEKRRTEGGAQ